MSKIRSIITSLWYEAMSNNIVNIISLLEKNESAVVLDIGCSDGIISMQYKQKIFCRKIIGIEGDKKRVVRARRNGMTRVVNADLEEIWPFPDQYFDVLIANQVIEHIVNVDHFIYECYRVLRPGGYCIISTENLASWHNIGALILGYQDFSHSLISKKNVGNPFSLHHGKKTGDVGNEYKPKNNVFYPHIKIPTYISLIEIFKVFGFIFKKGKASGYYPFFGILSRLVSSIDPYHSHFITVKMVKPYM